MTTLVTGGSGVVGRALLTELASRGRNVRALVRSDQAASTVKSLGANPVRGDVLDNRSLAAAMQGCDVVYHVAGSNEMCLSDPSVLFRVNVDGSRNALRAAAAAGVRRLVYTSSATTLGEERGSVGDEWSPHRGWFLSNYERSKYEAEKALLAEETTVELVVVNPSSVQGPGRSSGTGKLFLDLINGKIPAVIDSRFSIIDIEDCARGHLRRRNPWRRRRTVRPERIHPFNDGGRSASRVRHRTWSSLTRAAPRSGAWRGLDGRVRVPGNAPAAPVLSGDDPCDGVRPCLRGLTSNPRSWPRVHTGRDHPPENDRMVCGSGPGDERLAGVRALAAEPLRSVLN